MKRSSKKYIAVLMCILIIAGVIPFSSMETKAETENSTKKLEILLSSKIGGSYSTDDYKKALLAKLKEKGYQEENIRFIDSTDNIKTTSISDSNWNLFDHLNYIDSEAYEDTVYTDVTPASTASVKNRDRHIYSLNNGKEITFLGYGVPAYKDFAIYKSDSSDAKVVNFDISADKVDTHTLEGAGFLVNAGVNSSGILNGYLLFYKFNTSTSGTVYLLKINQNALNMHNSDYGTMLANYGTPVAIAGGVPFTVDSTTKKINVNMIVSPTSIQCSYTKYIRDVSGQTVVGTTTSLFNYTIPESGITGENGFGPLVSYTSHSCSSLTMFTFSNLTMNINASSDNALKQTNWSDDSEVEKYYVNINDNGLGTSGTDDSILTSIIDHSVYYIGAGTNESKAKTDAELVNSITGAANFVQTTPGTEDENAISNIVDLITGEKANDPLDINQYVKNVTNDYSIFVVDNQTETPLPKNYEVIYRGQDGLIKTLPFEGIPHEGGTQEIPAFDKEDIENCPWIVVKEVTSEGQPASTKLLSTSDALIPVVDFIVTDDAQNQINAVNMTDEGITLNIRNVSYSKSSVPMNESNSTTVYTITRPDGTTITASSIALTKENAQTGDYKFTLQITANEQVYKVTKKVSVYNDDTKPSITTVSSLIGGAKVKNPKTVTIAFADAGSGLYKYAIIGTTEQSCPDLTNELKLVNSKDSAYLEATYSLPISPDGNYNLYAYAIDKSGNEKTLLLDTYTVTISADAGITAVNSAHNNADMHTAITTYANVFNISLTDYNTLLNKTSVYEALTGKNFTTNLQIKTAFEQAVVKAQINEVKGKVATISVNYTTNMSLDELNLLSNEITTLLLKESYLTTSEKTYLNNALDTVQKAILVKTKKNEPVNVPKDPMVIVFEDLVSKLPNPDTASDSDILAKESKITEAKVSYDNLGTYKEQVAAAATTKLDKLLTRLANISVRLDATKAKTAVAASGLGLLVTQEDIDSGENVLITLKVEDKTEANPNKSIVLEVVGDKRVGAYFDINLFKQVGESEAVKLTEIGTKILISIELPEHLRGKSNYVVIRVHDGVAEKLNTTIVGNTLTFETDRFSTYAIAYDQGASAPNTGDNTSLSIYIVLGVIAFAVIMILIFSRKKVSK